MKKLYFIFFMAFAGIVSGQETFGEATTTEQSQKSFKLYPNPAFNDEVHITTKNNTMKDIVVYDVFGEVMLRDRIKNNTLNISRLVPGVYVLQVTEEKTTMNRKLVVK